MKKIFNEFGGVITTALAIVVIVGLVGMLFTSGGDGWMDNAFRDVIEGFGNKVDNAIPGESGTADDNIKQNIILLSGDLPVGVYTLRYEDANGTMSDYDDICELEITTPGEDVAYNGFIPENCAPIGATAIGVYNASDEKVDEITLGSLDASHLNQKQYSFAAISDTHIGAQTAENDLKNALEYFESDADIEFTTICGDLTLGGSETNLNLYKSIVANYATKPVYAISGNHETNASFAPLAMDSLTPYTGQDLYYSFTRGDDVYIMMGMYSSRAGCEFANGELQWLYETLEANRNKRCFLFMHLFPRDGSGDAVDLDLAGDMLNNPQGKSFYSLLSHYSNVLYFHGHSHEKFVLQEVNGMNNYDNIFGCHSIHIPSLAYPKHISGSELVADYNASEGYIIDVYANSIVLRGRDFVSGKFLPIASYTLDTTIKNVPANTYSDPTGIIVNSNSNVLKSGNAWYSGSVEKSTITKISLVNNYNGTGHDESWDASISGSGQITAYRTGTEIIIAGNGNGIIANANSSEMFSGFKRLKQIVGLENLDVSNITNMTGMFKNCSNLGSVNLSGFDGATPADMAEVFYGCSALTSVDLSKLNLTAVNQYRGMFGSCSSLKDVTFPDNASSGVSNVYCFGVFENCGSLENVDMTVFSGKGIHLTSTFKGCSSLKKVSFGQNKLIACVNTFYNCADLESLDISGFDFSNIDSMNAMFNGCSALKTVVLPTTMSTSKVATMDSTFKNCPLLVLDCSGWDNTALTSIDSFNAGSPGVVAPGLN